MRREYANAMYHSYQEKLRKQREGISETPAYLGGEAQYRTRTEAISKSQLETASKHGSLYLLTIGARRTRRGVVYDKKVMLYVSRQLGHNRISIIAGHYLEQ